MGATRAAANAIPNPNSSSPRAEGSLNRSGGRTEQTAKEVEIQQLLLPVYYCSSPLTLEEKVSVIKAWKLISNGTAPEFWRLKKKFPGLILEESAMDFFGMQFYERFLDIHPTAKSLFRKSTSKIGILLLNMVSFILSKLDDDDKLSRSFTCLAQSHSKMGVMAAEYGLFGEVLFSALRRVLGPDYTNMVHTGWVKIFSRVLSVILPVAIRYELVHKAEAGASRERRLVAALHPAELPTPSENTMQSTLRDGGAMYAIPTESPTSGMTAVAPVTTINVLG